MMRHELKCDPDPFQRIWVGAKKCELRRDDGRGFALGDELHLREYIRMKDWYYGRSVLVLVTDIFHVSNWVEVLDKDGYEGSRWVVMSFDLLTRTELQG